MGGKTHLACEKKRKARNRLKYAEVPIAADSYIRVPTERFGQVARHSEWFIRMDERFGQVVCSCVPNYYSLGERFGPVV